MKSHPLVPDIFALGLLGIGAVLLAFPFLRIVGLLAAFLAIAYFVLLGVLRYTDR